MRRLFSNFLFIIGVAYILLVSGFYALSQGFQQILPVPMPNAFLANPNSPNIIQNGGMQVDQANEGASFTITSGGGALRVVDRWFGVFVASTSGAGNPTSQRQAVSSGLTGFANSVLITANATPSTTTPAALRFTFRHLVEGADIYDLAFGSTGALSVTASVWLKTSLTNANFGISIRNGASNRSYPHICNVPVAATWTQCAFTIPGDVTGTWLTTPGSIGLNFSIALSDGSTLQGTADVWQAGSFETTSAQTQFTNTAGATLEITGVKVERGPSATASIATPYATMISQLQRYYRKSFPDGTAPAQNAGVLGARCAQNPIALGRASVDFQFNPPMAATPGMVTYNPSAANANFRIVAGTDAGTDIAA